MQVYKHDISIILKELPEAEELKLEDPVDLFIATLGFEDRSHRIIDVISNSELAKNSHLLLIKYPTNIEDNNKKLIFFENAAKSMSGFREILFSRTDYKQQLSDSLKCLLDREGLRVAFDISTCSSYVFYPTMVELLRRDIDLTIMYSEAETYFPTQDEWEKVAEEAKKEQTLFVESFDNASFQSSGVDDVYPYAPFAEFNPGNRPSILVAVPNFSSSRMSTIVARDKEINKTSFENISWLIGEPPSEHNKWRMDAVRVTNNLKSFDNPNIQAVCTLKYKEMLVALENIWSENRYNYYMTIGSLGSKKQHLGTFFFLALHNDIGLWLAEPKEFNAKRFSGGHGDTWQIKFGSVPKLMQVLKKYMAFKWEFNR